jgi:predicted permease
MLRMAAQLVPNIKQMRAVRYSVRSLARNPAFSTVIVLLLAFGIGANTLIFTAVDVLLLRDLPVDHPEQLVLMEDIHPTGFISPVPSYPDIYRTLLRDRAKSFSEVFSAADLDMSFQSATRVENVSALAVSGNYYRALGAHAQIGRTIADDDDRAGIPYPVVLSHAFWQRALGGRANVLGQTIRLRGVPFTIAGVMSRSFRGLQVEGGADVTVPIAAYYLWTTNPSLPQGGAEAQIYLRLRPDVPRTQAVAEVQALYPGLLEAEDQMDPDLTPEQRRARISNQSKNRVINRVILEPLSRGVSKLRKQFAVSVQVLMGAVGALLLLVCANIAGLMLARGEAARKEIAVRLSLGATRFTVATQLMMDALVLSILGAAGALLIVRWGGRLLLAFLPSRRPLTLDLAPDLRVLFFAACACVITALAMSMVPALHLFRADLTVLMGRGGPRQRRSHAAIALVALQVVLSTILLIGGAALVRTLDRLRSTDAGVERRNLIVMVVDPRMAGVKTPEMTATIEQIVRRARELDGVDGVSFADRPLMRGIGIKATVAPTGVFIRDADFLNTSLNGVSLGHFENVGIRILAGRDFRPADAGVIKPRPAIVSQSFARRFFPNENPIGKTFGSGMNTTAGPGNLIIGMVADTKYRSMREDPPPVSYSLVDGSTNYGGVALHVRTRRPPGTVIAELRAMLASVGPGIAPSEVATMEQDIETSLWQERLIAALASVFAIASAVLVAIGLYGMLAYSIARRTREIGIRMALGARPAHMIEMVSRDVALSVVPGLILGMAVYASCAKVISPVLYGIRPMDSISISIAIALIAVVAAIAAFVPASRAIAIQPSEALRQD